MSVDIAGAARVAWCDVQTAPVVVQLAEQLFNIYGPCA